MIKEKLLNISFSILPIFLIFIGTQLAIGAGDQYVAYVPMVARSNICTVPSQPYDTIQSAIDGNCQQIFLTNPLYVERIRIENQTVMIQGLGPTNTTIDGSGFGYRNVVTVEENAALTLMDVTIQNGETGFYEGGGVRNKGTTHLINTIIRDNEGTNRGRGIYSTNQLIVEDSMIIDNYTESITSGSIGSGLYIEGVAHITNSTISGNNGWEGSGLYISNGFVTITDSTISNNTAQSTGAGIYSSNHSFVLITNTVISNNFAEIRGGGIANGSGMQIVDSLIDGNRGGMFPDGHDCGGGIFNSQNLGAEDDDTTLRIDRTEFRDNFAYNFGGGICNKTEYGQNFETTLEIYNSLFVGNSVIGYIISEGGSIYTGPNSNVTVENTTFVDNSAELRGGAIASFDILLTNVTIVGNDAPEGGGVFSLGDVRLVNSIIAYNQNGGNCQKIPSSTFTSLGNNIDSDSSCNLVASGDLPSTNPILGQLTDNGGQTWTMALLAGSPAIDSASNTACPPTDQRGVSRPQGPRCDIGAYEYNN